MNYRHAFHAGNFADVFKHIVLVYILRYLNEKPQAYRVIDTHAGNGLYDLSGSLANRTSEWRDGIGKLFPAAPGVRDNPILARYLDVIAKQNPDGALRTYPGSPLIALAVMRPQDKLTACELEPHAAMALTRRLAADRRAKVFAIDGFMALNAHVPPLERRGLVLIDPPFEQKDEFSGLVVALERAYRKWQGGIYMLWYPVKDEAAPRFLRQVSRLGIEKVVRAELHIASPDPGGLSACGVVIVNPPWRLSEEMNSAMPDLVTRLGRERGARFILDALQ
jgi:23S rRNA (adenine2030-N6)-methyltransferase